jgi:hypothetical protein
MSWIALGNITVRMLLFGTVAIFALALSSCGYGVAGTSNSCSITTNISPSNATADHSTAPPGNQAQFSLSSNVSGNCPLTPDFMGTWSTSDPVNVNLLNMTMQPTNTITAMCVGATSGPAKISNSSTIRGKPFPSASLTCN